MSETTTTKRTTRGKRTTTSPVDEASMVKTPETAKEVEVEKETKTTTAPVKSTKVTIDPNELIACRSIVVGKLLLIGKKTKIQYRWEDNGDIQFMEYQDLLAEMITNSTAVYAPYIMIEDDRILDDFRWKKINNLYDRIAGNEDIESLFDLPIERFKAILADAPRGLQRAIQNTVSTKIANGTFDSIQKLQAVDEICHTDFACLIAK